MAIASVKDDIFDVERSDNTMVLVSKNSRYVLKKDETDPRFWNNFYLGTIEVGYSDKGIPTCFKYMGNVVNPIGSSI